EGSEVELDDDSMNLTDVHSDPCYVQHGIKDEDTSDEDSAIGK
ncbi:hypothetical protein AVEN_196319-1, partial [Araneus ventricosus]